MYFDSHAHYDDRRFKRDRDKLLADLPGLGVTGIINSGACITSSKASVALANEYPYIYATVGVHPHEVSKMKDEDLETLTGWALQKSAVADENVEPLTGCTSQKSAVAKSVVAKSVVAIGEIGLDFHYDNSPRDTQRIWFAKQLALAKSLDMPVVIHSREAAAETMSIIKDSAVVKGVLHCYSGHLPMALEYIDMGFYISLGGPVTYKNAQKTQDVAANIPLNRLLIETDAPYLPPVPFRGKRNDSSMLPLIAEAIAELRGITQDEVALTTAENARKLFGIQ